MIEVKADYRRAPFVAAPVAAQKCIMCKKANASYKCKRCNKVHYCNHASAQRLTGKNIKKLVVNSSLTSIPGVN